LDESRKSRRGVFRILFVCAGNTCRSPMATGILRKLLPEELLSRVEIDSAGVGAVSGEPALGGAVEAAAARGVDISRHVSKKLTPELVRKADLILVMERSHMDKVREMCPAKTEHVMLLTELGERPARGDGDIADPIGGTEEVYRRCYSQIEISLARGAQFIADLITAREDPSELTG